MAATPDGKGYWLAAMDGGVFAFGDAAFYGSMGATRLNKPVVGMAATPDGKGYWLVASDGGIFAFGDAPFKGSMGGTSLSGPGNRYGRHPSGKGYWLVAADGGIFSFGNAPFRGSAGRQSLNDAVVGMAASPQDTGYLLVETDGTILSFGGNNYYGSLAGGYGGNSADVPPVAAIALTPNDQGYWLLEPDGWNYSFSNPPIRRRRPPLGHRVGGRQPGHSDPDRGISATPTARARSGVRCSPRGCGSTPGCPSRRTRSPESSTTGPPADTAVLPPTAPPAPGDAVLYGTGPCSTATSLHVGLVDADVAGRRHHHHRGRCRAGADQGRWPWSSTALTSRPSRCSTTACPIYAYAVP